MQGSAEAELAYARLEALCQAVKSELQQDLHIHDAAVLPNFVNLPKVAAAEYGRVSTRAAAISSAANPVNKWMHCTLRDATDCCCLRLTGFQ